MVTRNTEQDVTIYHGYIFLKCIGGQISFAELNYVVFLDYFDT